MKNLDDKIWKALKSGYKMPYDPTDIIKKLEKDKNSKNAWEAIWEELHHQGTIGDASYAIIPYLIDIHKRKHFDDWQIYSFVSLIIQESRRKTNPKIPKWIEKDYSESLKDLFNIALKDLKKSDDKLLTRSILGFLAFQKNLLKYGAIITAYDESEIDEFFEDRMGWSEIYTKNF
ncbi:MAG: hypothetical protein MUF15_25155 [Acidobacteria bacterium]|jgi:hypothetical protein|nr:hypothetical protein [Acidobacteriota bacterium]